MSLPHQTFEHHIPVTEPVERPAPRKPTFPVTYTLIALNVLVYVAMVAKGVPANDPDPMQILRWGADFGPLTLHGQWWRLITACFIHFGIAHIGMNMYSLYQVGRPVEALFGRAKYLLIYAVAGLGGDLASLYIHPDSVSAGASGAIFGVFGATLSFVVMHRKVMSKQAATSIMRSAGLVLVINLVLGFSVKEIDLSGHVGGFLTGFLTACYLARRTPDGSMRLPLAKGLIVALATIAICAVSLKVLAVKSPGNGEFYQTVLTGPSVPLGDKSALFYTGSATRPEAQQLANALAEAGLDHVELQIIWNKTPGATTLLIAMAGDEAGYAKTPQELAAGKRPAPWNNLGIVASFQKLGQAVAPLVGGAPYNIILTNEDGETRKTIPIE